LRPTLFGADPCLAAKFVPQFGYSPVRGHPCNERSTMELDEAYYTPVFCQQRLKDARRAAPRNTAGGASPRGSSIVELEFRFSRIAASAASVPEMLPLSLAQI